MGSLALTSKAAYRQPFEPLPGDVVFVEYGDAAALAAAVDDETAAVVLEPVQGEAGVIVSPPGYLAAARDVTTRAGALLWLDEVQTGIGRSGDWFAHSGHGVVPDLVTLAKGLGGGVPIGACIGVGTAGDLLQRGDHGATFGGNPVSAAAALAVIDTIEKEGLLEHARHIGRYFTDAITELGHPLVAAVTGPGLLLGIQLTAPVASPVAYAALDAGFIVSDATPDRIRLAPPLVLTTDQVDETVAALPRILDTQGALT